MINLIQFDNEDNIEFTKTKVDTFGIQFNNHSPIAYSINLKKFIVFYEQMDGYPFVGIVLCHNESKKQVHVLYKNFLLKDPIKISSTIKDRYMQTYIKKKYDNVTNSIIRQMPRIKKLKRMNLKMMNRKMASYLYTYINEITKSYQYINGYEQAQFFKASLMTTPFYVNDDGIIKIYRMDRNELTLPEYDGANFLSYFTFSY